MIKAFIPLIRISSIPRGCAEDGVADAAETCCGDGHEPLTDVLDHMNLALGDRCRGLGHTNPQLAQIDLWHKP